MGVKCVADITRFIEELAPVRLAEDWDNVGLLVGSHSKIVDRVMVCLDVTSQVVDEAVKENIDLIISHHPLIFKGIKRINEDDPKGRILYSLIKHDISVYSAHTNLDVVDGGINHHLANLLGLKDVKILSRYKEEKIFKIVVFVPMESVEKVRASMCSAGAGWIGKYSDCTFLTEGEGTFKPLEGTNPYIGAIGSLEHVKEYRLETVVPQGKMKAVIDALIESHPYEEAAYDVYPLELSGKEYGMGNIGVLPEPQSLEDFISVVKSKLDLDFVRLIGTCDKPVKKVAVFCGSFDESLMWIVEKQKADVLVTGDIKHHTALDMIEMGLCVIDAGHYGTERIIVPELVKLLSERFPSVKISSNSMETNPIKIS